MPFQTNTKIDMPAFALKIRTEFANGIPYFGTGFIVDYNGRSWLFTCWHNVGSIRDGTEVDLTGDLTALKVGFVETGVTLPLVERRIVGARVDDEHLDVVAIELFPTEMPPPPWFAAKREVLFEGIIRPQEFVLGGIQGGERIVIPIVRHYIWQGFPGSDVTLPPVTCFAADFPGSSSKHPWMLRYTPGGHPGSSGCPVQELIGNRVRLAGIHVHWYRGEMTFRGRSSVDGRPRVAAADFEWGGAVPIEMLYAAIDKADARGVTIAELSVGDFRC